MNHRQASLKPGPNVHSIAEIVEHLTLELLYARQVVEGTAARYGHTWAAQTPPAEQEWAAALARLKKANRALVRAVLRRDDALLEQKPRRVRGPFYLMLHGTIQHTVYHAGQIVVLKKLLPD